MKEISLINAQLLPLTELTENNGQIEGLPANPRTIEPQDFANLKKSIEDNPEMLGMRELLVYKQDGQYIVIGGNMRLKAMRDLGYETAPCKVLPKETTIEQLKAILIKDNVQKGEWDTSMLLEDWDAAQLSEWGVEVELPEAPAEPVGAKEDDFDETKDAIEVRCKQGDIWQLGDHRLMCGDSIDLEDVKRLLGGAGRPLDNRPTLQRSIRR